MDYQQCIQNSRGEFGWAKPAYVHLETVWISDRTVCYLASGKPAIVQDMGRSRFLPNDAGLFRFRTFEEAANCLNSAAADHERHCKLASALAEEYFDASELVRRMFECALWEEEMLSPLNRTDHLLIR